MVSARVASQKAVTRSQGYVISKCKGYSPKVNQKNTAPAFFVLHHPGSPFTKSFPLVFAFGSFAAFLQPGSVQAEIVVMKLHHHPSKANQETRKNATHAMRILKAVPAPARMNDTRTSFKARASRAPLSYFSYTTGTKSINNESTMPDTDTNIAKPVRPAEIEACEYVY